MLVLRPDWLSVTGGAVATSLVVQLESGELRDEVASQLTGASLDLLVSTWPRRGQPPLILEKVQRSVWRISCVHYIYLLVNDDPTINTCINLARSGVVTAILPRRYERLKRQLLTRTLRQRLPSIWSFDAFISWRTISAAIDQQWPPGRAVFELLIAYNRRIIAGGGSSAMLVQVPEELL